MASFRKPTIEAVLGPGTSVILACPHRCAGNPIDNLAVYSEGEVDVTSLLSGISPALRFSLNGELSIGRLSPGRYRFRLWAADQRWEREVTVGTQETRISFQ